MGGKPCGAPRVSKRVLPRNKRNAHASPSPSAMNVFVCGAARKANIRNHLTAALVTNGFKIATVAVSVYLLHVMTARRRRVMHFAAPFPRRPHTPRALPQGLVLKF